jgi:trehalose 6-phosphate synthase/phosphatase
MSKTIIVSNRLPVKISADEKGFQSQPSEGGLATGLGSIYKQGDNLWIGWPGLVIENPEDEEKIRINLKQENMQPVFLTHDEIRDYYEGFSNETLWPTFHYFLQYAEYDQKLWESYVQVNQKFCDEIIKQAEEGDTLWIHDYQLLLLPEMVRKKLRNASIGFFLHIPFPSFEVFRLLPWRRDILNGMLGSDLLGFHTYDDMRHFLSSVSRLALLTNHQGHIETGNRTLVVDSFPMGIDYQKYAQSADSPETRKRIELFAHSMKDKKLIISIDRLDYSKGIPQRLRAYELFLDQHPEFLEKVTLYMVVVPSRDQVGKYKNLKVEVDELVGRINGKYGRVAWTPVHYFYRSLPLEAISAFYRMAHVALVTPMRDGMNLVCKEYVASKTDQTGVLILSEMAGASKELSDAISINPNDINQIAGAIHEALTMPLEEQHRRIVAMQKILSKFDIHHWVSLFMKRLHYIKEKQRLLYTRNVDQNLAARFKEEYRAAQQRLFVLDYGGTLVSSDDVHRRSGPDRDLCDIIESIAKDPKNMTVIISGMDKDTLGDWFKDLDVDLIAEHGAWLKKKGGNWYTIETLDSEWKHQIFPVLEQYIDRTPGSYIEEKDFSLVWRYNKVEHGLGEMRSRELTSHLKFLASGSHLHVLEGDFVVEIKNIEVNKGKAVLHILEQRSPDFVFAIGDDWTDEEMFKVLPETAITIRVGSVSSAARFSIINTDEVRDLLKDLTITIKQ